MAKISRSTQRSKEKNVILWALAAVIIIALAVAGYVFMQNDANRQSSNTANTDTPSAPSRKNPIGENLGEELSDDRYIVLEDWGIKFKKDVKLLNTNMLVTKSEEEVYYLTTSRIQSLGGRCMEEPYNITVNLSRQSERPSPPWTPGNHPPVNENPINGYFYTTYEPIVGCSGFDSSGNLTSPNSTETEDKEAILKSLETLTEL